MNAANADAWGVGGMPCTHTHTHTHTHAFAQLQRAAEYLEAQQQETQQETLPISAEYRCLREQDLGYKIRISNLLAQIGEVEDMHGMSPAKRPWQQRIGTLDEERREREHSRAVQKISTLEIQLTESKELVAMREAELEAIRQSQQVPAKKAENV